MISRLKEIDQQLERHDSPDRLTATQNLHTPLEPQTEIGRQNAVELHNPIGKEQEERINVRLKAEERIDAIRAEVLQAMERLERIEAEG